MRRLFALDKFPAVIIGKPIVAKYETRGRVLLCAVRKRRDLSQDDMALDLGISQPQVSSALAGNSRLSAPAREAAKLAYRIPTEAWLLPSEGGPEPNPPAKRSDAHGPSRPQGARSRRDRAGATAQAGGPNG